LFGLLSGISLAYAGFFLQNPVCIAYFWRMVITAVLLSSNLMQWIVQTGWLEWCGVFTGILCVWLAAKNNIYNWPIAIVSVIIYLFIFLESKLYADMGLQIYFLLMNVYGWYFWNKNKDNPAKERPVSMITHKEIILSLAGIIIFTYALGTFLYKNTDASFPFVDSFCTACSLMAQLFLARKVLQNWLIWIFVDIIYVGVYISKDLYATAFMYALYIYIAAVGYLNWRKTYREQNN
jgi:nicotinamide mononucleotide transporter